MERFCKIFKGSPIFTRIIFNSLYKFLCIEFTFIFLIYYSLFNHSNSTRPYLSMELYISFKQFLNTTFINIKSIASFSRSLHVEFE